MKLNNKNIILTGASSGIGAELCKLLCEGNKVFAVARNISKIPEHPNIISYSCDVSRQENLDSLFTEALKHFDSIDVFIANAGYAYFGEYDKAEWEQMSGIFNTNVFSAIYSLQKMREISGDKAFNFAITASGMSYLAMPGYALYSATKFALKGFTDALRFELKKGQVINMVYPIATLTSFFDVAGAKELPWPRQEASVVAKKIIKGISKNKKHIFPSALFASMLFFNRFLPLFRIYKCIENRKFKKSLGE